MAYELQQLLVIREKREDTARGKLQTARQAVFKAEGELEARKEDLRNFEATKEERRSRIYDAVMGRRVKRDDLELAREGISRIDQEGVLKTDNVKRAEEVLTQKQKDEEKAKDYYISTAKEKSKIVEHKSDWERMQRIEEEYRQDIEMEDFTGKKVNDDLYG